MLDLGYSDSDASDTEQAPAPAPPPPKKPSGLAGLLPKPKSRASKHKDAAADPAAPKKIVVTLPKFDAADDDDDRPAKKARTGGMSGLNAMLPAPKRAAAAAKRELGGAAAPPQPKAVDEAALEALEPRYSKPFEARAEDEGEKKATSKGNTMFVPQSVARRPIQPMSAFRKKAPAAAGAAKAEPAKPKVSLFGSGERCRPCETHVC